MMRRLGCLTPLGLLAALITLSIVGSVALTSKAAMFSPGALSARSEDGQVLGGVKSHAELVGDCTACHVDPWSSAVMASRGSRARTTCRHPHTTACWRCTGTSGRRCRRSPGSRTRPRCIAGRTGSRRRSCRASPRGRAARSTQRARARPPSTSCAHDRTTGATVRARRAEPTGRATPAPRGGPARPRSRRARPRRRPRRAARRGTTRRVRRGRR